MKNVIFRRGLCLLLSLVLLLGLMPVALAQEETTTAVTESAAPVAAPELPAESGAEEIPEEAYDPVKEVFAEISKMEEAPAKRNASAAQLSRAAEEIVKQSESYLPDSLERNGSVFTWKTVDGISCMYSPELRKTHAEMKAPENPTPDGIHNWPEEPSGRDVFLIAPYYGYDDKFKEDYYKQQAANAAAAIGDTDGYTLVSGTAVTIDIIAEAISYGAVVFLDSHGTTNYQVLFPRNGPDFVTKATANYMCIRNENGINSYDKDLNGGFVVDYDDYGNPITIINGDNIAYHMELQELPKANNSIVWMSFCFGMALDSFYKPLREDCGVEVVYGYSQSISFAGDYCYEMNFWPEFLKGATVGEAMEKAKKKVGEWDFHTTVITNLYRKLYGQYVPTCDDINTAIKCFYAFPIVVSDEDPYPGRRTATSYGVDDLQTVKSTYTLLPEGTCGDNLTWKIDKEGTLTISGTGAMPNWSRDNGAPWSDYRMRIDSVVIEDGITSIGNYAFDYGYMSSVTIPDSVTAIGIGAFNECIRLTAVDIPDNVTIIGNSAFSSCINLTTVAFGKKVETIDHWAFSYCYKLTDLTIGASVANIGTSAFRCCEALTKITFRGNAPSIGENAFGYVTATAYYFEDNATWTEAARQNYGGTITWEAMAAISGDFDGNMQVDNKDVEYLLWYTLFPEDYPISSTADFDGDGVVANKDVEYLLWHTLFPDDYPLAAVPKQ